MVLRYNSAIISISIVCPFFTLSFRIYSHHIICQKCSFLGIVFFFAQQNAISNTCQFRASVSSDVYCNLHSTHSFRDTRHFALYNRPRKWLGWQNGCNNMNSKCPRKAIERFRSHLGTICLLYSIARLPVIKSNGLEEV